MTSFYSVLFRKKKSKIAYTKRVTRKENVKVCATRLCIIVFLVSNRSRLAKWSRIKTKEKNWEYYQAHTKHKHRLRIMGSTICDLGTTAYTHNDRN